MKRCVLALLVMLCATADAHVGSPDVFLDGDAGPYSLFVTIRTPDVIPGVATIEIRSDANDIRGMTVVPMRLTGPGSEHPPTPDAVERSTVDPHFYTASLWLMEHGSMQVRISVDGARGAGTLSVPVPAYAQRTLAMPRGLGTLLLGLMALLATAIVAIVIGALREAALPPGEQPQRRYRVALVLVSLVVVGLVALGRMWWSSVADDYERMVMKPWLIAPHVEGCELTIPEVGANLLPDHGHMMHLFLVREPALDELAHLHPQRDGSTFVQPLPALPAGRYAVFADIVLTTGFPITGTAELELPDLRGCAQPIGDDSTWTGAAVTDTMKLADGGSVTWNRPAQLRAGVAQPLEFRVLGPDGAGAHLEPYMGMAAHAEIVRTDMAVFAHIHPNGSVAMPALELAQNTHMAMPDSSEMMAMPMPPISPTLTFPFGFPKAGDYRVFVQFKRAGVVETAAFEAHVN